MSEYIFVCRECESRFAPDDHCRLIMFCKSEPSLPLQCIYLNSLEALWRPLYDGSAPRPPGARARVRACVRNDDEGASREDGA